ncbi:hypothetical protein BpHYR1_032181 [Brachionus plicatilis]|uniref:Uncharacterized protein n=1 Tax=Brachionus plicatilis TaxID=10195 RepID=A0A3M7QR97_BRAPC|nr:hypothetical protein BpHYR1_032181 [Brachionus plicatilis]
MASQEVDFCIHYALPISELFSIHCSIDKRLAPRSNSFLFFFNIVNRRPTFNGDPAPFFGNLELKSEASCL